MPSRRRFAFISVESIRLKHSIFALALIFCLSLATTAEAQRAASTPNKKYAAIVIEADTGYVLHAANPDKKLAPASLTKMMTLYMTFEALRTGKINRHSRLYVSDHAASQPPSKLDLKPGSTITVEQAILALVTKSANDVAVVIAEKLGGTEARFAQMMTTKARALGMNNTNFRNASGLHHPQQISTARDMARLSQALLRDYPEQYKYFSTTTFYYKGTAFNNHNRLMTTYDGMDGIKTGYVQASGFNLAASASRNGTRLIGVVFGGRTAATRNAHMARLLDRSFDRITDIRSAGLMRKPPAPQRKPGQTIVAAAARPVIATRDVTATAAVPARPPNRNTHVASTASAPSFNAMGLVMGEGDVDALGFKTITAQDFARRNDWAVQVGAFSTRESGMRALEAARAQLPSPLLQKTEYLLVPLNTNRGVIYRARIAGLDRDSAGKACNMIEGSCLVLAAE